MNQHTGLTSALRHPSPIRPHPSIPRCQHLIFWLSNSINLRSEILFVLQLSNQLTDRLRKNNIKVLAEVRLQANDPKRAIRTIKVTVLVWPSLRAKCLSFVSSANSWKRSTKKTRPFHLPQDMDQLFLSYLFLSQECIVCSLSQPKGVRVTHLSLIAKQPVKFVFSCPFNVLLVCVHIKIALNKKSPNIVDVAMMGTKFGQLESKI